MPSASWKAAWLTADFSYGARFPGSASRRTASTTLLNVPSLARSWSTFRRGALSCILLLVAALFSEEVVSFRYSLVSYPRHGSFLAAFCLSLVKAFHVSRLSAFSQVMARCGPFGDRYASTGVLRRCLARTLFTEFTQGRLMYLWEERLDVAAAWESGLLSHGRLRQLTVCTGLVHVLLVISPRWAPGRPGSRMTTSRSSCSASSFLMRWDGGCIALPYALFLLATPLLPSTWTPGSSPWTSSRTMSPCHGVLSKLRAV